MKTSLNHTYRLVWSDVLQTFVPVAECARGRGKGGKKSARARSLLLSMALLSGAAVQAQLPTGGQVVAGSASMASQGKTLTVTQTSERMAADWQSFSIGQGHTVNFVQPGSHAVALNRVLGSDVSVIQGALNANGQVFLVNPNGVLFTKDAQVNVGGIVASTLNISTQDFMAGHYKFEGASSNAIVNQGNITAHGNGQGGGTVALIAARISNEGTLTAEKGNVLMGAGRKVTLDLGGPVKIQVEEGALDALIEQGGGIKADGGLVYLTAKSAGDLVSTVINHSGITEAQTLATGEKGEIYLMGDMAKGRVSVGGTLDASAPNGGDGGFIETSAAKVAFADRLNITTAAANGKTGQWLIDPVDFTVAASGGDITGSALGTMLGSNSVTIQTVNTGTNTATEVFGATTGNGDIFVNDSVTWSSANTLTLNAHRNIEINSPITASHASGKLVLEYGQGAVALNNTATYTINAPVSLQSGNNFSSKLGSDGTAITYTLVNSQTALQGMALSGNYALGSSLTFTGHWTPVGNSVTHFTGKFDGLGNTISDLSINFDGDTLGNLGLFGSLSGASVSNLSFVNADILGGSGTNAGILAGNVQMYSSIRNITIDAQSSLTTTAAANVGGLVGTLAASTVTGISSNASFNTAASNYVGGLVGYAIQSTISSSTVGSSVAGNIRVGGLVGNVISGTLRESTFTGATVSGRDSVGGALGYAANGAVMNGLRVVGGTVSATDHLSNGTGYSDVGGIVGAMYGNARLTDSLSTAAVSGTGRDIGGAVGYMTATSSLERVYATGNVTMTGTGTQGAVGGLVGAANGTDASNLVQIKDSYATGNVNVPAGGNSAGARLGVGSFAGFAQNTRFWNTYAVGSVDGQTADNTGGFLGMAGAEVWFAGNNFYDKTVNPGMASSNNGKTTWELRYQPTFTVGSSAYDTNVWSFGAGEAAAGFGASLPYLTGVTRTEDRPTQTTLFAGGWGGLTNTVQTGADGSAYTITNVDQLRNVNLVATRGYSFALSNDINLSGVAWKPIGNDEEAFTGSFDGQNHTLSNLTIAAGNWHTGLFAYTSNAAISNVALSDVSITGELEASGALVGSLNGGTVSNVSVSGAVSGRRDVGGLVGRVQNGSINNSSSSATVTGTSTSVGGLVGKAYFSTPGHSLTGNRTTGTVTGKTGTGGLIGALHGDDADPGSLSATMVTVSRSYASGNVDGGNDEASGGLIGEVFGLKAALQDLYATGDVSNGTGSSHGGLIGSLNAASTLTRAYATGAVSVAGGSGLIGSNADAGAANVFSSYWDTETTGKLTSAGGTAKTTAQMKNSATYNGWDASVWGFFNGRGPAVAGYELAEGLPFLTGVTREADKVGSVRTLFDGGWGGQTAGQQAGADGTAYGVSNWNQLQNINLVVGGGYSFELKNNLDTNTAGYAEQVKNGATLANGGLGWKPIGSLRPLVYDTAEEEWTASGSDRPFVGVFDGKNNSITGLTIQRPTELPGSPAANQALDSSGVGLFGYVSGSSSEIRDLKLIDPVVKGYQHVGAVVGFMEEGNLRHLTAENIALQGGGYYVGGVVGSLSGNATGLLASGGQVTGAASGMGGVIGYNEGSVTQSSADVNVTSQRDEAGGLVGSNSGTITASSASGAVSGKGQVGGLVGYSDGSIASSHALGNVTNTGTSDGAGGLVGTSEGSITDSYASGNVTSPGASYAGGLVGYSDGNISLSYASGEVRGDYGVGGLVGWANSWSGSLNTIEKSHASGLVIATDENSGGLVGIAEGTKIENSYASGSVSGTRTVGGLVGSFGGESRVGGPQIINSYAIGPVTGTSNVGGLVGYDSSLRTNAYNSVVSSFWDKQTTGQSTSAGGVGKTTAEMQDIALYSGWSIEDDTSLTESYARLTMTATGTVWKIKSVAYTSSGGGDADSSGTNNNGGTGSGSGSGDQGTGSSGTGSSGTGSSGTGSSGTGSSGTGSSGTGSSGTGSSGTGSPGTGSSGSGSDSSASGGAGGATDTATGSNGGTSASNTGGSSNNADSGSQSPQLTAAIQSAQQAAQQAVRQAAGGSDPSSTGPVRSTLPTPVLTGFNPGLALGGASAAGATAGGSPAVLSMSGGLAFVNVNASPAESTGSTGQATGNAAAAMPEGAGRDPAGFMRVFVVNGGINLPTLASDAAVPGQGVN